jgi:hypothetical protein
LWFRLRAIGARHTRRFVVSLKITYKYLPPRVRPVGDILEDAELVSGRVVASDEEPRHNVGDVVQLPDYRPGSEERSFKVVRVGNQASSHFAGERDTMMDYLNVYVQDLEDDE